MANGANRIFNIIRNTNIDTVSEIEYLTIKSKSGNNIEIADSSGLILSADFFIFDSYIDISKIQAGDKFKAITINGGQLYYIFDIVSSAVEIDKYIQRILALEQRATSLEGRMSAAEARLTSHDGTLANHESRISALERQI